MKTDPSRKQTLRRAILDKLGATAPHALPEVTLLVALRFDLRPEPQEPEFADALLYLHGRGYIRAMEEDLDETRLKWFITEPGKTLLKQ